MKKVIFFLLCFLLLLTGCQNFLSGNLFKKALNEKIEYENAPEVSVRVQLEKGSKGKTFPNSDINKKINFEFEITHECDSSDYSFVKWIAEDEGENLLSNKFVEFEDDRNPKTNVTIKSKISKVIIKAVTLDGLSYISINTLNEDSKQVYSKDKTTVIKLNHPLPETTDLSLIKMSIDGEDIVYEDGSNSQENNYYLKPRFKTNDDETLDTSVIYIEANQNSIIPINRGLNRKIGITIPGSFYFESEDSIKYYFNDQRDFSWTYLINDSMEEFNLPFVEKVLVKGIEVSDIYTATGYEWTSNFEFSFNKKLSLDSSYDYWWDDYLTVVDAEKETEKFSKFGTKYSHYFEVIDDEDTDEYTHLTFKPRPELAELVSSGNMFTFKITFTDVYDIDDLEFKNNNIWSYRVNSSYEKDAPEFNLKIKKNVYSKDSKTYDLYELPEYYKKRLLGFEEIGNDEDIKNLDKETFEKNYLLIDKHFFESWGIYLQLIDGVDKEAKVMGEATTNEYERIIRNINVSDSVKLYMDVFDSGIGLKNITVIEHGFYVNSQTKVEYISENKKIFDFTDKEFANRFKQNNCIDYELLTEQDGGIVLEFIAEDYVGNKTTITRYVVKNTLNNFDFMKFCLNDSVNIPAGGYINYNPYYEFNFNLDSYIDGSKDLIKNKEPRNDGHYYYYKDELSNTIYNPATCYFDVTDMKNTIWKYSAKYESPLSIWDVNSYERPIYPDYTLKVTYDYDENGDFSNELEMQNYDIQAYLDQNCTKPYKTVNKNFLELQRDVSKETYLKFEYIDNSNGNKIVTKRAIPPKLDARVKYDSGYLNFSFLNFDVKKSEMDSEKRFDYLLFYTYQVDSSSTPSRLKYQGKQQSIIEEPGFMRQYENNVKFYLTSMPDGIYNFTLIPCYIYSDGSQFYGDKTEIKYTWNSSSKSSGDSSSNVLSYTTTKPPVYNFDLEPLELSTGYRKVKVTFTSNFTPSATNNYYISYSQNKNKDYEKESNKYISDDSNRTNVIGIKNLISIKPEKDESGKYTATFEVPSGYYYDFLLFYRKASSSTAYYYNKCDISYVYNMDLTEDNIPPYLDCDDISNIHKYVMYPDRLQFRNYGTINGKKYNLLPKDDHSGIRYHDVKSDCFVPYYIFRNENQSFDTRTITREMIDKLYEGMYLEGPDYPWLETNHYACFDAYLDDREERELNGEYIGNDYFDISIKKLNDGYYTLVFDLEDQRLKPGTDLNWSDDPASHEPNKQLVYFTFRVKTSTSVSNITVSGTSSNYTLKGNNSFLKVDYLKSIYSGTKKWEYYTGADSIVINSTTNKDLLNEKFLRITATNLDDNDGETYLYNYLCPEYYTKGLTLSSKNIIKGDNGYQVYCDAPVYIHAVGGEKIDETLIPNYTDYEIKKKNIAGLIESKCFDYSQSHCVFIPPKDAGGNYVNTSFTYTNSVLNTKHSTYTYVIAHFADGTVAISEIKPGE